MTDRITLSLVSHTNLGKTTLARTLLRRDVGEVLDQAHVTDENISYELIGTADEELLLWDTPGFGDSARLLARLRRHDQPVLWFVQQLWDKVTDRPLWCSQQAALNIREEADVVLYLVNASEEPLEAGYVTPELELLSWIGRPILLLLNQTGSGADSAAWIDGQVAAWRSHTARWEQVRDVVALDAFSRCWVQESTLLERVEDALEEDRAVHMRRLRGAWDQRNLDTFRRAIDAMAEFLSSAAIDREPFDGRFRLLDGFRKEAKEKAMQWLGERLQMTSTELMSTLIAQHGLEGKVAAEIDRQIDAFLVAGDLLNPEKGALWGGMVSGAVSGLAADVLAGGLTFGGGVLAGAILGALGGAGLAKGYQLVKGERPAVSWSPAFLDRLAAQTLLRYLAVAHFGRGRGEFQHSAVSERWRLAVAQQLRLQEDEWLTAWKRAVRDGLQQSRRRIAELLDRTLRRLLVEAYPEASSLLWGNSSRHKASAKKAESGSSTDQEMPGR